MWTAACGLPSCIVVSQCITIQIVVKAMWARALVDGAVEAVDSMWIAPGMYVMRATTSKPCMIRL